MRRNSNHSCEAGAPAGRSGRGIVRAGETCWRTARAERVGVIVDAAAYFAAVKKAVLAARHSVVFIGWDFDTRIRLDPVNPDPAVPDELGAFLSHAVEAKPELEIYVLRWDLAVLLMPFRGTTPLVVLDWTMGDRIHLRLDHEHPLGSSHHQKIVVVDDALAFCGGIDMTTDRWDTSEHRTEHPRGVRPDGSAYGPWHDITTVVDGAAARALGVLARERWRRATGEEIAPPPPCAAQWPSAIVPRFEAVEVAIARTLPAHGGEAAVREIEALYLEAIASARESLYVETQYLACDILGDALRRRLEEPDGPEIVVVMPRESKGWLEPLAMDTARVRVLAALREADRHDRLRVYHPVTRERAPIYVHAKILVVDDRLLRVGSSNMNNRGLRTDSECDIAIEAAEEAHDLRARIAEIRDDLLAEHLDVDRETLRGVLHRTGSLVRTIETLARDDGRSLTRLPTGELGPTAERIADSGVLDPERPEEWSRALGRSLAGLAAGAVAGAAMLSLAALSGDDERDA